MDENTSDLTPKQLFGIEALLSTRTIEEAAKKAKVSPATLYRWLQTEAFKTAYRDSKARILNHSMTRLQSATTNAVDTLIEIAADKDVSPQTRITASKAILNFSLKAFENEQLIAPIEALETVAEKRSNR